MSVLKFSKKYLEKNKIKNKKFIITIIALIVVLFLLFFIFNSGFRNFITIYIFRKQATQNNLTTIELSEGNSSFVYAYDKYITVLNKNTLYTYNSSGNVISENDIPISSPIYASNNRFLAIGEKDGNNIYLVSGSNIIWQGKIDGKISKINVNNNGYVSVIVSGTSYQSIIVSYNSKGKELFKTYLSNTKAIDTDISANNKYLSVAEVDYSGSLIKSMIKTISIEKAMSDPTNSVIYTYTAENNNLITDIKYQSKDALSCMYNNSIHLLKINSKEDSELINFEDNYNFSDINLKNNFVTTTNLSSGFSSKTNINIHNAQSNSSSTYTLNGSIKSLYAQNEKIAINTGSEIHFIGLNGWLIKKYTSSSEINNITLGDNIAGVVYKDKIEIVQF